MNAIKEYNLSPTLSIITINYNNREGLQKTIDSVINQTYKNFEWIIIDGGSTDGSKELIEKYSKHFSYWVSEEDKGIYNAMNKGILRAKGDYLQFLNSGDALINSKILERVMNSNYEGDVLYGDAYFCLNGETKFLKEYPNELTLSYIYKNAINHQASFIRKDVFKYKLYNENNKVVSDWELFVNLLYLNKTFIHLPFPIVFFEMGGIGSQITQNHLEERHKAFNNIIPPCIRIDCDELFHLKQNKNRLESIDLYQMILKVISMNRVIRNIVRLFLFTILFLSHIGSKITVFRLPHR